MDGPGETVVERNPLLTPGPSRLLIVVSLLGSLGLGRYQAGSPVYFVKYADNGHLRFSFAAAGAPGTYGAAFRLGLVRTDGARPFARYGSDKQLEIWRPAGSGSNLFDGHSREPLRDRLGRAYSAFQLGKRRLRGRDEANSRHL